MPLFIFTPQNCLETFVAFLEKKENLETQNRLVSSVTAPAGEG